jgi:hypothetical protein
VLAYLKEAEIPYGFNSGGKKCERVEIYPRWAVMELLGRLQPVRLMPRAAEVWEGGHISRRDGNSSVRVVSVEDAGIREVVSLGTSTGTYIANGLASHNCGRHFYQLQETRTFAPVSVWECPIDDLVSTPSVVSSTQVNLDYEGNGVYSVPWTLNENYQLKLGDMGNTEDNYNINAAGVPRPYRNIQVLAGISGVPAIPGGGWFPWLWPYTYLNRVQVIGTWGWNVIPPAIQQASMMLAVDLYKSKDAPWGVAGVSDLGIVRVQSNPWVVELLHDFVLMSRKAGV